jgi:hypothetical protein
MQLNKDAMVQIEPQMWWSSVLLWFKQCSTPNCPSHIFSGVFKTRTDVCFPETTHLTRVCVMYLLSFKLILSCFLLAHERELSYSLQIWSVVRYQRFKSQTKDMYLSYFSFPLKLYIFSQSATPTLFTMLCVLLSLCLHVCNMPAPNVLVAF